MLAAVWNCNKTMRFAVSSCPQRFVLGSYLYNLSCSRTICMQTKRTLKVRSPGPGDWYDSVTLSMDLFGPAFCVARASPLNHRSTNNFQCMFRLMTCEHPRLFLHAFIDLITWIWLSLTLGEINVEASELLFLWLYYKELLGNHNWMLGPDAFLSWYRQAKNLLNALTSYWILSRQTRLANRQSAWFHFTEYFI